MLFRSIVIDFTVLCLLYRLGYDVKFEKSGVSSTKRRLYRKSFSKWSNCISVYYKHSGALIYIETDEEIIF